MTRKFTIAAAMALALATSLMGASAAPAVNITSGTTSGTTYLTAAQIGTNLLDFPNGSNMKCTQANLDGSFAGNTATELTLAPTFSGCTTFGQTTTVDVNGCDFRFTTATGVVVGEDKYDSKTHIECPAGASIVMTVGDPVVSCTKTIHAQTPTTSEITDLTGNTGAPKDIILKWTLEGIKYTSSGGICGATNQEAKLTGEMTLRAYSNVTHTAQVDLFIN